MFEKISTDGFKTLLTTQIFELPKKVTMPSMMKVSLALGALAGAALAHMSFGHTNSSPSSFQKKNDATEKPSLWQQFKQKAVELKVTAEKASKSGVAFIKQHSKEVSIATVAIIGAALILRCKAGYMMAPLSELQKKANYGRVLANAQSKASANLKQRIGMIRSPSHNFDLTSYGVLLEKQLDMTLDDDLDRHLYLLLEAAHRRAKQLQMKADAPKYFAKRQAQAAL